MVIVDNDVLCLKSSLKIKMVCISNLLSYIEG